MIDHHSNSKFIAFWAFMLGAAISVSTSLLDIACVMLIVSFFVVNRNYRNIYLALKQPVVGVSLIIYATFVIGVSWSSAPAHDILHMLIKMDVYALLPFLLPIFAVQAYRRSIWSGFVAATVIAAILSIVSHLAKLDFYTQEGIYYSLFGKRQHIFQGHTYQNYFSGIAAISLIAQLMHYNLSARVKALYVVMIGVCIFDTFFIMPGRTGQILFIMMLVLFFIQWRVKLGMVLSGVLLVVLVPLGIIMSPNIRNGIDMANKDLAQYNQGNVQTSIGARFEFHKYSIEAIKKSPVFGHGTGSFHQEYMSFNPSAVTSNPHNDFLWFGVELGAIGVLLLCCLIGVTVYQGFKAQFPERYLLVIIPCTYAVACVQNSFFTDRITAMAYVVLISSLLSATVKNIKKVSG